MAHAHKVQAHGTQVTGWVGWVITAAFLMGFAGALHIIYGLGALMAQGWYITSGSSVYFLDTTTWGWSLIIGGVLMILVAALLYSGNMAGRILGGIVAIISIIANMALFVATPIWSTIAIVLGFVILYAIIAHGGEMKELDNEAV